MAPETRTQIVDSCRYRRSPLTLPSLSGPGLCPSNVIVLGIGRSTVEDFQYTEESIRDLDLAGTCLLTGRITVLQALTGCPARASTTCRQRVKTGPRTADEVRRKRG